MKNSDLVLLLTGALCCVLGFMVGIVLACIGFDKMEQNMMKAGHMVVDSHTYKLVEVKE